MITGPTATGKTTLAAMLALKLNGEVVSADSMQIYKHMNIGTAKPTEQEMMGVRHHMVDFVPPYEDYSVARYVEEASECIREIKGRGKIPILAGGTGLYIESLLLNREFTQRGPPENREAIVRQYDEVGGEVMLREMTVFDPVSAKRLHPNDKKRIVRAFEVYKQTGKTITQHDEDTKKALPRYAASLKIALTFKERADLYERIDKRVDRMIAAGLEKEVRDLLEMGVSSDSTAMQAIGYKEMAEAVIGKSTVEEATERIKMETRRYAKRQLSWLRRDAEIKWIVWEKAPDLELGMFFSTEFFNKS